jgi:hypothetical protein
MQNDIGIVNINLKRGNNKAYTLSFFNVDALGIETPKDLRVYNSIKMDIKKRTEVESPVVLSLAIGAGLQIIGNDFNVLEISFDREFIDVNDIQYIYDILFQEGTDFQTLIGGLVNISNTVTI